MKKHLTKILALVLSVVFVCGLFSGCKFVKTDSQEDSKLIIAKVKLEDDKDNAALNVNASYVYKRDMYSAYMSYGYYYVNSYGYTSSQTFQTILDNLVQNAVVEQYARRELVKFYEEIMGKTDDSLSEFESWFKSVVSSKNIQQLTAKDNIENFLSDYQIAESKFEVKESIANMIKNYSNSDEEEDEQEIEAVTFEERKTPYEEEENDYSESELKDVVPTEDEYEAVRIKLNVEKTSQEYEEIRGINNVYDLNMYLYENFTYDVSTKENRKALSKALQVYKAYGVIPGAEKHPSAEVEKYSYFVQLLETEKVEKLVSTFQDMLETRVESNLTNDMLYSAYKSLYLSQEVTYNSSLSDYETAISSTDENSFVVYNPFEAYGYVTNLLIGFTTEQTNALSAYKNKNGVTVNDVIAYRDNLAKSAIALDQRAYWTTKGYGEYDSDQDKYVFDSKYFLSEEGSDIQTKLSAYLGQVVDPVSKTEKNDDEVEHDVWTCSNAIPTAYSFSDFYDEFLHGVLGFSEGYESAMFIVGDQNNISFVDLTETFKNGMADLIYAFSTDGGSLSAPTVGYLRSPNTNSYVNEFKEAAATLVERGVGAYTMVVTDYGIHVMVCTEVIDKNVEMLSMSDFINQLADENSLAYRFKNVKIDSLISSQVQKELNDFIATYLGEDSSAIKYYKSNYSDLI